VASAGRRRPLVCINASSNEPKNGSFILEIRVVTMVGFGRATPFSNSDKRSATQTFTASAAIASDSDKSSHVASRTGN